MAKQIVAWCDAHLSRDEQVPGEPVRVTLNSGLPLEVDLCEPCAKELVEPLSQFLEAHGQPVKTNPAEGGVTCAACGKSYKQPASLRRHMREVHEDPALLPAPDGRSVVVPDGYPCPDCDRTFDRPQALGRHRSHQHGYVGTKGKGGKGK